MKDAVIDENGFLELERTGEYLHLNTNKIETLNDIKIVLDMLNISVPEECVPEGAKHLFEVEKEEVEEYELENNG